MSVTLETGKTNNSWLISRVAKPRASFRLFCLPFAGGGASVYRDWHDKLPGDIEVYAIQYPGRENRISERPIDNLHVIVNTLCNLLIPKMDIPYAFFGHSLGAKLAFETAKKLSRDRGCHPVSLFVSGCRAPHIPVKEQIHQLEEDPFVNSLRRYAGTPEAVLQDRELMNVFLPMLRADFVLDEKYTSDINEKVDWPIYAFAGDNDEIAPVHQVEQWRQFTTGPFDMTIFKGDHFFFKSVQPLLFDSITKTLNMHSKK